MTRYRIITRSGRDLGATRAKSAAGAVQWAVLFHFERLERYEECTVQDPACYALVHPGPVGVKLAAAGTRKARASGLTDVDGNCQAGVR